ncbi:MAG: IS21 family transposase [Steroidobacteraceae bacterium]
MGMLAKIKRMRFREKLSIREIVNSTGLARNTVRTWLRQVSDQEPRYPARVRRSVLDPYKDQLRSWLQADHRRPVRDRRTAMVMFRLLQARGYPGGYKRVSHFARAWREEQAALPSRSGYVPLKFELGEAFQFDWSCEYAVISGVRHRLEVAHIKLASSRAFWVVAYPTQTHEMLFDAHARAFAAFGGVPKRGIYDNMKTAVDRIGRGKERVINARFQAMCNHYLFEPEFCNRAAGWEKGIVEKNVQDRRRQLWQGVNQQHWSSLSALNDWLAAECKAAWLDMRHPDSPDLTLVDALEQEQDQLMPLPRAFDGYVEHSVRVSSTALVLHHRNRYSVPSEHAHHILSLRVYPTELVMIAEGLEVARHDRSFQRDQTFYDWQHYIPLLERKPGALRNGAPFTTMPEPLMQLRHSLLRHVGGDRVMAQVLAAVPTHGLEAVLVSVELALESGRPSGEHVLNVLARLKGETLTAQTPETTLTLVEEPRANVQRYDGLRPVEETCDVD